MAVTQLYTAVTGDTITAARWNNEFGNIYSNGSDIPFPLTKAVSLAGWTLTLDSAAVTSLISSAAAAFLFTPGVKTGTPGTNGSHFNIASATFTDNATAVSGTAALWTSTTLRRPTLAATNTGVTTTEATTLYIENAPAAGTNETLTNAYAIHVEDGTVKFDGALTVDGTVTFNGAVVNEETNTDTLNSDLLANCRINVTMSGSAVTVALKGVDGNDPSSTNKVRVRFRNATLANAGTTQIEVSAALSVAISSGSTLGTVSGQATRIYVGLLNNSGTAELFVYNPLSLLTLVGLHESSLITTTAEGGAGGADSAQVTYSTTARTSVPFRLIGYFECTQATAGTWDTAASKIQDLQPWMPRTGHIIQTFAKFQELGDNEHVNASVDVPIDDTIPQVTEGVEAIFHVMTPEFAGNLIDMQYHSASWTVLSSSPSEMGPLNVSLYHGVSSNALVSWVNNFVAADLGDNAGIHALQPVTLFHTMLAATTASTRYSVRFGISACSASGNIKLGGTTVMGGVWSGIRFKVQEIMA